MSTYCITPISESSQGVGLAMGAVDESLQAFARDCITRVQKQSSEPGAAHKAGAAQLKTRLRNFCAGVSDELERVDSMQKQLIVDQLVSRLPIWVRMLDELMHAFEESYGTFALAPREVRRKHANWLDRLKAANADTSAMREMLLELLEQVDPTPEDFLELELKAKCGDDAGRIMRSFDSIATSNAFTLDAFKQRQNLR